MADVWGQKFDRRKWLNVSGVTGQENSPARTCKSPRRNEHMWKDRNRPSYNRLDSTGENSASSSEDLSCGFSPKIQGSYRCRSRPKFRESSPFTETPQFQGGGLLDKVRSVIDTCRNQYLPPQSQRNTTRNLTHRTPSNNQDSRLANLDSVAEKFTNMSMANMNPQHWSNPVPNWQQQRHTNGCGGPAHHGAHGQWGRTTNVSHDRNHTQIFHPYQEFCQPPLLSSIQNYQRNCPQPWQHMMGGNHPCYPPFNRGFNHFTQPWQHQQRSHPPYPWQWIGPQMMQACGNQGPMTRQHQQRARSPAKKQRWNRHGNQKRTCPQSKSGCHTDKNKTSSNQTSLQARSDIKTSVDRPVQVAEVKDDGILSKEEILVDTGKDGDQVHVHVQEVGDSAIVESVRTEKDKEQITIQGENLECQTSHTCKPEVSKVHDTGTCNKTESEALQRHSSIDLILSDYEVQSSTRVEVTALSPSSDLEDSDGDSDSAVETNADLWESFTATDDPYNPLCGWRCSVGIQEACPGVMSSVRDCHVDSGTDEGDNWSETDSDDDYDSGDDLPDDDVDTSLPRSLRLSDPQLKELRENLSSTPKEKSDQASLHHPSVAFVLGATSTSSEEDDDDDDWDTLDDPSSLKDDPLWDSFNRARDPYSPMEAWKCQASNLSSTLTPPSPSQTTPIRKQDSVEGLRTILLASTEREATLPQRCEKPRDSDGEGFAIATVRVYAARDDIDLGSPNVTGAAMKRVASASCLRRVQLTPQNKANKKVRFCPYSSFIVLVEKDAPSCENNPSQAAENDWQACARDRMRFKARIDQLSLVLNPVLTNAHRERIYASRMASKECR